MGGGEVRESFTLLFEDGQRVDFELKLGGKEVFSIGRSPKSDVRLTEPAISWTHLELRLVDAPMPAATAATAGPRHALTLRDKSANGTGLMLPKDHSMRQMRKDVDMQLEHLSVVCFPLVFKAKKTPEEIQVQTSFTLHYGKAPSASSSSNTVGNETAQSKPRPGVQSLTEDMPPPPVLPTKRRTLISQPAQDTAPKRSNTSFNGDDGRLKKGESLLRAGRQSESRDPSEALSCYRRGLRYLLLEIPGLEEDDPRLQLAREMVSEHLDRASRVKRLL